MVHVIDVREPSEYRADHVEGAVNLPLSQLTSGATEQLDGIKKDEQLIVYCRSGGRSAEAISILRQAGFKNLINGINKGEVEGQWCDT
jgi:rhodanese-related sulfurtransferase